VEYVRSRVNDTTPHFVLTHYPAYPLPFSLFYVNIRSGSFNIRRRQLQNQAKIDPDGALAVRQGGTA
jgi:hypothetical protein